MNKLLVIILTVLTSHLVYSQSTCTIEVTGMRSNQGKCLIYVFKAKKGFPTETDYAASTLTAKIDNGSCKAVLNDLSTGEYAVMVVHDENSNNRMDTNFIGMPKEGIGTSNNAKSSFGPPSFDDSKFKIDTKQTLVKITLKYL